MSNYYKILGIPKNATDTQIKKAYRKLALKWHPDKNKSRGAEEKFMEITEAYDILSDPEKRRKYDRQGRSRPTRPTQTNTAKPNTTSTTSAFEEWQETLRRRSREKAKQQASQSYGQFKKKNFRNDWYNKLWVVNVSLLGMGILAILLLFAMIAGLENEYDMAGKYDKMAIRTQIKYFKGLRLKIFFFWLALIPAFYCLVKYYPRSKK